MTWRPASSRDRVGLTGLLKALRWGLMLAVLGCSIQDRDEATDEEPSTCSSDEDCLGGRCDPVLLACVAESGAFDTVVFEIVPPTSVRGYGGLRFFEPVSGLGRSSADLGLFVPTPTQVKGVVLPSARETALCPAASGDAARVTFTPVESLLGLGEVNYRVSSKLVGGEQRFELSLPSGVYDVYVEPLKADDLPASSDGSGGARAESTESLCARVPQLTRSVNIEGSLLELRLAQSTPQSLDVVLHSQARFDGWTADLVHPVTGQLLSTRSALALHQPEDAAVSYRTRLLYSVSGVNDLSAGQELLRLSPPPELTSPVVYMQRAGLEVFRPGEARIGSLAPFGAPVDFRAWVLSDGAPDRPVPATVTFTAMKLTGVADGIFASFSVSAETAGDGEVRALLLPGTYRVRTVPAPGLGLAASQTTVTVWPIQGSQAPLAVQAGSVISVPASARLTGSIELPPGLDELSGIEVHATPAAAATSCSVTDLPDGGELLCDSLDYSVLKSALAEDPFVPRHVMSIVDEEGEFSLDEADCSECRDGHGALFDVSIRPPSASRLPWQLRPEVFVDRDLELGTFPLVSGIVHQGTVGIGDGSACSLHPSACVPGALIRAYVVLDGQGGVASDPPALQSCAVASLTGAGSDLPCARAVLQIAETRAKDDGSFELVLPAQLD